MDALTSHATSLIGLPDDLKISLLEYIYWQSDLIHLAKTCRTWYNLAIPVAYKHVQFDVDRAHNYLLAMLEPSNQGLQYARKLTVSKSSSSEDVLKYTNGHLDWVIRTFAGLLPKHQLLSVRSVGLSCTTLDLSLTVRCSMIGSIRCIVFPLQRSPCCTRASTASLRSEWMATQTWRVA